MFTCFSAGTSFVDGAVSINNGGKDSFVNGKLLVDTGALLPFLIPANPSGKRKDEG